MSDGAFVQQLETMKDRSKRNSLEILENPARTSGKRQRSESFCTDSYFEKRGRKWKRIKSALKARNVRILYLPLGMTRQKSNKTYFKPLVDNSKEKDNSVGIFWTIEVKNGKERKFLTSISEEETIKEILKLSTTQNTVKLINEEKSTKIETPVHIIDISITLKEALQGKTIIEYPTFSVE